MAKKQVKKNKEISGKKSILLGKTNPDSFYDEYPIWSFKTCDFDHDKWGVNCSKNSGMADMLSSLKNFETMTWGTILTMTNGRKENTRNHPISVSEIDKNAQKRLIELNLDDVDILYSLAIGNKRRIWGRIINRIFFILWLDEDHSIYHVEKKHT